MEIAGEQGNKPDSSKYTAVLLHWMILLYSKLKSWHKYTFFVCCYHFQCYVNTEEKLLQHFNIIHLNSSSCILLCSYNVLYWLFLDSEHNGILNQQEVLIKVIKENDSMKL